MQKKPNREEIPYVAVIDNVGEITLRGTADYDFWAARLKSEGLVPVAEQGRAKLLVSATIGRYNGIRFRELCFLVEAKLVVGNGEVVGCYMPHAFNSVRLYAWIERTFFSCPYHYAKASATLGPPVEMTLTEGSQRCFEARLVETAAAVPSAIDGWQGPIFLPTARQPQLFFAKLRGATEVYPFSEADTLRIEPQPRWPILACLAESDFRGSEWHLRRSARHAKSQTVSRDEKTLRRYGLVQPCEAVAVT